MGSEKKSGRPEEPLIIPDPSEAIDRLFKKEPAKSEDEEEGDEKGEERPEGQ